MQLMYSSNANVKKITQKKSASENLENFNIHVDGTHKLVKNCFSISIVERSDSCIFPISIAILSHESEYDFDHYFSSLKLASQNVFNKEMVPDFSMQNCCPASSNNSLEKKFKAQFSCHL